LNNNTYICNNIFKNTEIEARREKLIDLIAEIINFQIKVNKDM